MDLDDILGRLERLEAENAALRDRLEAQSRVISVPTPPAEQVSISRRQLVRRAGAAAIGMGILAATGATLGRSDPVRADGESILVGDDIDTATRPTTIRNRVNDETLFEADSDGKGTAVIGNSAQGVGVVGIGRVGGAFIGTSANVQLLPSASRATHPRRGTAGVLFVDQRNRLWFCKGGTAWRQLA